MPAASVDLPPSILRLFVSHTGMDPDLIVFVSHVFTSTSDFVSRPNSLSFAALEPNEYFKKYKEKMQEGGLWIFIHSCSTIRFFVLFTVVHVF